MGLCVVFNQQYENKVCTLYRSLMWQWGQGLGGMVMTRRWFGRFPSWDKPTWWRSTHESWLWVSSPQWLMWINPTYPYLSHVNHWGELTHNHDSWVLRQQVCWDLSDAHTARSSESKSRADFYGFSLKILSVPQITFTITKTWSLPLIQKHGFHQSSIRQFW